ncbi:MAG: alpha/beta hydrolase [Arcanobacterium sp.]
MTTLNYRRSGPKGNVPLVLLHALPVNQTMWDQVRSELPDVDLITVDAPGFGNSPEAEEFNPGPPSGDTYINALKATLDLLGVDKIALGGLSMGGSFAADFATAYPAMVAGLALMDTNIGADDQDRKDFREQVAQACDAGEGYDAVKMWLEKGHPADMIGSDISDEVRADLDRRFQELKTPGLAWIMRALAEREDATDVIELIDGPVYFIRGSDDPTCSLEYFMELALKAKSPRIVEIEGAGHFTADEKPVELAQVLREFAQRASV